MPAKATLFNTKCEPVFELGTGPRNSIYYNPHGNILLLGGFGNLRGQVEVWNMNNRKKIGNFYFTTTRTICSCTACGTWNIHISDIILDRKILMNILP